MKKLFIIVVSTSFLFLFSGCNNIKEYNGLSIDKLIYETVDYYGGYTTTYIFDFINNKASENEYLPGEAEERVFTTFATFTDEQEKIFMDYCAGALFMDFSKTTFNATKYNLNRNHEDNQGKVIFYFYK